MNGYGAAFMKIFARNFLILIGIFGNQFLRADDWPQWLGPQRDGVWRESGLLDRFPKEGPKVLWKTSIGGGYAGPAVVGRNVYVVDRLLSDGQREADNPFTKSKSLGTERILCLQRDDGKVVWSHEYPCQYSMQYPCGPRCTPTVIDGQVFVLGAMGHLTTLDATSGKLQWKRDLIADFGAKVPVWGFASHPLVVGNLVITLVGGKSPESVIMAFERSTGKLAWKALSLESAQNDIGYCPPTLIEHSGRKLLIAWHPEAVCALVPETGKVLWQIPFKLKANLSVPTPRYIDGKLLVSAFYNGSMLIRISESGDAAEVVWKGKGRGETPKQTDGLHSIMATPYIDNDHIYGVCSYGELRCIRLSDGSRVWENLKATGSVNEPVERWANAFLVRHEERTILFNEKGDLIISRMTPVAYEELSRAHVIEPTGVAPAGGVNRKIVWSHPAFANKCVFVRNDREIICISMAK